MCEGLSTGLRILFGFVTSQLGFLGAFWSFYVCVNSNHLANFVNVDGWLLKVGQLAHMHRCTPQVRPSQDSSFLLSVFCSLDIWVGFWIFVVIHCFLFLGELSTQRRGADVNRRCLYERYQLWLEVLESNEVASHIPCLQCLWSWNCIHLLVPMLGHNLLILWVC